MAETKNNDTYRMYGQYWKQDKIRIDELLDKMSKEIITKIEYQELQYLLIRQEWIKKADYPLCKKIITGDKLMFIADTHYGNKQENQRLIYFAYNEALKKNIKTVINAGDMTEGTACFHNKSKDDVIKEIEKAKNDIPHELVVELLFGNHEHNTICEYPDIILHYFTDPRLQVLGMYKAIINWDNQASIRVFHDISRIWKNCDLTKEAAEAMINIEGHHHSYNYFENIKTINLASLSNFSFNGMSESLMKKGLALPDAFVIGERVDQDKIAFHEYCLDRNYQGSMIAETIELNTKTKELRLC